MKPKRSAYEIEKSAAAFCPSVGGPFPAFSGEAMAMLVRRGLKPEMIPVPEPFPRRLACRAAEALGDWMGHYAFRLFLRGAIRKATGFLPEETTRYLTPAQSRRYAEMLESIGLAEKEDGCRYRLNWPVRDYGVVLEWYIGRELERRYAFDVATGVKLHARGAGGDLDVVAAAEGKLVYIEAKSSPPKNLDARGAAAFCARLELLRPDVALFVVDTALRLSDKVVPMLFEELHRCGMEDSRPKCIAGQTWAVTPHVYAVNGSRNLAENLGKAIAAGFRAMAPGRVL